MTNLANILSVAMCLAWPAKMPVVMQEQPFVTFEVAGQVLDLGLVWGPRVQHVGAKINGRIVANCPYHVEASFRGLRHVRGLAAIAPKDLSVVINGQVVPVGAGRAAIARSSTPTPAGGVDVPIEMQVAVKGLASYPAGRYSGTLVVTVMAGP
jgi:hypothetical protein